MRQLEIGDELQRFEVSLTKEIPYIYKIASVTKTLAKTNDGFAFKRQLIFNSTKPIALITKNEFIAEANIKGITEFSTPRYFLIKQ